MKKILFWLSAAMLLLAASCKSEEPSVPEPETPVTPSPETPVTPSPETPVGPTPETALVTDLFFFYKEIKVVQYQPTSLKHYLSVHPVEVKDKATIDFQTADSTIAIAEPYWFVTGQKVGETTLTASANGYESQCLIIVEPYVPTESMALSAESYKVHKDKTIQLKAKFTPFDATFKDVQWSSSDPAIASVDENGLVTAHQLGDVTITCVHPAAHKEDKQLTDQCTVSVVNSSSFTYTTETVNGVNFEMVEVEGGTFEMGATPDQGDDVYADEIPVHTVTVSSFYLAKTEVTQAQYQAIMGVNPSQTQADNLPVDQVSWNDAKAFCEKLSQLSGKKFVLPTEAQWEYAARGGKYKENTKYAGSNNAEEVAWYSANTEYDTLPVATMFPNALGLYDMSGNVAEWCADMWGMYKEGPQIDPTGSTTGNWPIIRGGSRINMVKDLRVASRNQQPAETARPWFGFRIAMIP